MANAIVTFKIIPADAETDLEPIKDSAKKIAEEAGSKGNMLVNDEPLAFGLKCVIVKAMYEVEGGDFEGIANKMAEIENVQSAEMAGMDLPLG